MTFSDYLVPSALARVGLAAGVSVAVVAGSLAVAGQAAAMPTGSAHAAHHAHTTISSTETSLGRVVSSKGGHVMFRFMKDRHEKSKCSASCRSVWPPVMSKKKAKAGSHINDSELGRTKKGQVTYYDHPLYYYIGDPKPGRTKGDGITEFGAKWYVVSTHGKPVKKHKSAKPSGPSGPAEVTTGTAGKTTVLTDAAGRTLYELSSESDDPPSFTCTGSCESVWPPLLTKGAPTAAGGADDSLLGTVTRPDGTTQVTYKHHPLYAYTGDTAAGTANGDGLYDPPGYWYDLTPTGAAN